jgi:hypothetical protein
MGKKREQMTPQAPQLRESVMVLTSQPLPALPSQSAKPGAQPVAQPEDTQAPVHTVPQAPQLFESLVVLTSQPFAGLPSQFAKPGKQAPRAQVPEAQVAAAFAKEQDTPQAPQWIGLLPRLTSQPLPALPSQLSKPALQDASLQLPD